LSSFNLFKVLVFENFKRLFVTPFWDFYKTLK